MADKIGRTVLFACSGASNVGQIANALVVKLVESGLGGMSCIAGIGAHDKKMIEGVRLADKIIAIDGCGVACSRKILEHADITLNNWINVTDYGIKKTHTNLNVDMGELQYLLFKVTEVLSKEEMQ